MGKPGPKPYVKPKVALPENFEEQAALNWWQSLSQVERREQILIAYHRFLASSMILAEATNESD